MRLIILDKSTFQPTAFIGLFQSVQWDTTFNTANGWFQVDCDIAQFSNFLLGDYVVNSEDQDHIGVITQITTTRSNQKQSLQVSGVMLHVHVLQKRVLDGIYNYINMSPIKIVSNLIDYNLTQPADVARKIPFFGTALYDDCDTETMEDISLLSEYGNLGDEVLGICQSQAIGVKTVRYEDHYDLVFYTGKDHTFDSEEPVVISRRRGTALEMDYTADSTANVTSLYVKGEDNTVVHISVNDADEVIERCIDVSSEVPWPTATIEVAGEEGGTYYRYIKTNPQDITTNYEVWSQYAVDKIEAGDSRYETDYDWEETDETTTVDQVDNLIDMTSEAFISPVHGIMYSGSEKSAKSTNTPKGGVSTAYTTLTALRDAKPKTQPRRSVAPAKASVNSSNTTSSRESKKSNTTSSIVPKAKAIMNNVVSIVKEEARKVEITADPVTAEQTVKTYKPVLEQYTAPSVTYETKEFLDYVYVTPGLSPTNSTQIIQGSVQSGDIMVCENFKQERLDRNMYLEALTKKGDDYIASFGISENLTAKIYPLNAQRFKQDYGLGDYITCIDDETGLQLNAQVSEALEVWDSTGYSVSLTLGYLRPQLSKRIYSIAKGGI